MLGRLCIRLFIVSPDSLAQRARCQAETPLIVLFRFLRPALFPRDHPSGLCRRRPVDARLQCGIFLSCRRVEETLRQRPSIAPDARIGNSRARQWMELHYFGYHRQSGLRQQFHPGRLSAVPAAISVGVAEHALLAQIHQAQAHQMKVSVPITSRWAL